MPAAVRVFISNTPQAKEFLIQNAYFILPRHINPIDYIKKLSRPPAASEIISLMIPLKMK